MTDVHLIDELDRKGITLSLTPSERRALRSVANRLGVEWHADGTARVYSQGNVGSVALSPDLRINVTTKVPIGNLLTLASLAFKTAPLPKSVGTTLVNSVDQVVDWLAFLLISELEQLMAYGLRQDYVLVKDALPYIRGRMLFEAAPMLARPGLTLCEFADLLPDTPENRVLRAALELLATRRLLPGLRPRVDQLLRYFAGVTLVQPSSRLIGACRITRLNQHYGPALELSRLLIEQSGIEADLGPVSVPAYFFPMESVFEKAVTNLLTRQLANVRSQTGKPYKPIAGTTGLSLTYAADIVVGAPPRLVIDTKYAPPEVRNQFGGWSLHNNHIYQVVFYALSLGCPALLVYPRVNRDMDATFDIEGIRVSIVTVDLQEPGLESLDTLVEAVAALVNTEAAA